jgi:hypothetical protein
LARLNSVFLRLQLSWYRYGTDFDASAHIFITPTAAMTHASRWHACPHLASFRESHLLI